MAESDVLKRAQDEYDNAYRLFNATDDPRLIDEAIMRMRTAEMRLDYITHPASYLPDATPQLPWLQEPDEG